VLRPSETIPPPKSAVILGVEIPSRYRKDGRWGVLCLTTCVSIEHGFRLPSIRLCISNIVELQDRMEPGKQRVDERVT